MCAKTSINVLHVEDSPTDRLLAEEALAAHPFDVQSSQRLSDALLLISSRQFDVVLLDLGLPDSQGLDTLRTLRGKEPKVAVVVLTGKDDELTALTALQEGAQDYLVKGEVLAIPLERALRYAVERKRAEEMLQLKEKQVEELTEHIHQVLWMIDIKVGKVVYVSRGYEELWGRPRQTLLDDPRAYLEGIHPLDRDMMDAWNAAMYRTGRIDVECRVLRPDGAVRWVWIRGYPIAEEGRVERVAGVIEDITDRRRLTAERDALLARHQLHIERMPLAYVLFDAALRVTDWNPAAERIFGYSRDEALGLTPLDLVPPTIHRDAEALLRRLRAGDMTAHSTNENLTKDRRKILCEWLNTPLVAGDGSFAGLLCLAQDVTERKSLEDQFRQAQKMEAVGQLAGGVAHDFNNLLTIISGYSEFLLSQIGADDPMRESVAAIGAAGERAASLTRQLLAFSRRSVLAPRVVDLNAAVRETEQMLRRLIGEDVEMTAVLDPALRRVKLDPGTLNQVVMNLAINARDAMPKGGRLTLETCNVDLDAACAAAHADVRPGKYVLLAVSDTGSGMTPEVKARIFEPFFTTKGAGKGTGLGLSVVHGIVKQSGGRVEVYSEPGLGTTFRILLPSAEDEADAPQGRPDQEESGGTETVLLVEDEDGVRALALLILRRQGYNVLEAGDGKGALKMLESHQGAVDLLLTDVVMPGMSGGELAEFLQRRYPRLKVLFTSGYPNDSAVRQGNLWAGAEFLQKPYSPQALARKVRAVLDKA